MSDLVRVDSRNCPWTKACCERQKPCSARLELWSSAMYVKWSRHVQMNSANITKVLMDEPENEITLTAFRLLVMDLLALFYVMNEGVINILGRISE